jgi:hypothetical protein
MVPFLFCGVRFDRHVKVDVFTLPPAGKRLFYLDSPCAASRCGWFSEHCDVGDAQ